MLTGKTMAILGVVGLMMLPMTMRGQTASTGVIANCGDSAVEFAVRKAGATALPQPEQGRALVYFIEKDAGGLAPTTQAALDGHWVGATHGDSFFAFAVDPGLHHLCAVTKFSGWTGGQVQAALAHFQAEAGKTYYFEAKNMFFAAHSSPSVDVSLAALDSDEGAYLVSRDPQSTSHAKR
jgi:hypothetical protein